MATDKTKAEKEYTVEEKLKTLYDLQTILSEIDRIKTLRGELPLEVQDLEDEIAGLETRIKNFHTEIEDLKAAVSAKKVEIQNAQTLIEKYTKQQDNVRNNREFDFLSKEIEYQTLEIQLCEKRINEFIAAQEAKSNEVAASEEILQDRQHILNEKKSELDEIVSETKQDEEKLREKAKKLEIKWSLVCCLHLREFVRTHAMVWQWFIFNAILVEGVSIVFHLKDSSISKCVRKLSFVNIADVL